MNRRQKPPQRRPQNPAYRQAFERLDEALVENTRSDNSESNRLLRQPAVAGANASQKSGTVVIPN